VAVTALCSSVIEKYVTLSCTDGGVDSAFSMEPGELKMMILGINDSNPAIGGPNVWGTDAEEECVRLQPSLRFERDLPAASILDLTNF
jgi:N-acetylneuraminate synthase